MWTFPTAGHADLRLHAALPRLRRGYGRPAAAGHEVNNVRDAPYRAGLELVFLARRAEQLLRLLSRFCRNGILNR